MSERAPIRSLLHMGVPRALSLVGTLLMGAVDVAMVSPLGTAAVGAMAMATAYVGLLRTLMGNILQPADVLIAQARGRGDQREIAEIHRTANQLSLLLSIPVVLLSVFPTVPMRLLLGGDADPALLDEAATYCRVMSISAPLVLVAYSLRVYVDAALKRPWIAVIILLVANVVNLGCNWVFIYGHLGMPRLGTAGSAWATNVACGFVLVATLGYILANRELREGANYRASFAWSAGRMRQLVGLGVHQGLLIGLRNLYFAFVAGLTARLGATALAAGQIAFSLVMLVNAPQAGFSWGGSVVVAHEYGRSARREARHLLHKTYLLSGVGAAAVGLVFVVAARPIASLYSSDLEITDVLVPLLQLFALFHLATSLGFVGRAGLGAALDNRYITAVSIGTQFLIGLPITWLIGLELGGGPVWIWTGPIACEIIVAVVYYLRFRRLTADSA